MMANHKANKFVLGNELVELEKGQFVTSELKLMERWDWGKAKLRSFLDLLEKDEMIVKKSDRKKTVITICNYGVYHDYETENRPQADHEQTTSRPIADTNKNVKNVKNEKELKTSSPNFSIEDMKNTKLLFELMQENNPDVKKPNLDKWADVFRLMREKDKRTDEQIKYLIHWTQSDEFWKSNILSPSKLRKQWDQLVLKAKTEHEKKKQLALDKPIVDYKKLEEMLGDE
jgi:DNA replication protein DnaD